MQSSGSSKSSARPTEPRIPQDVGARRSTRGKQVVPVIATSAGESSSILSTNAETSKNSGESWVILPICMRVLTRDTRNS